MELVGWLVNAGCNSETSAMATRFRCQGSTVMVRKVARRRVKNNGFLGRTGHILLMLSLVSYEQS